MSAISAPNNADCSLEKTYYNLKMAIDDAHRKKHDSHRGPRATEEQMALVDKRVREGTRNGQSLEYIYHFNEDIHFVFSGFQIGRKYEKKTASESVLAHVTDVLRCIMPHVGEEREVILLSDNGKEFSSLPLVEKEDERIWVFYTNPYRATDKSHCERNHEYFRYVCPKGNSFDDWTQEEIDSIFSNINSYARNELNWKRPYDLFIEPFTKEAAKALGISGIDASDVDLASKF